MNEDWLRGLLDALAEASQQRCTEDNAHRDPGDYQGSRRALHLDSAWSLW